MSNHKVQLRSAVGPDCFVHSWMKWIQGIWGMKMQSPLLRSRVRYFFPLFSWVLWDLAIWVHGVLHRPTIHTREPFKARPFLCVPSFLARSRWWRGVWHGVLASWVITTGDWAEAWRATARLHFKRRAVASRAGIHPADLLGYRVI